MFFSERLRPDHDLARFSSGNSALDVWLKENALHADRSGTGRTYVLIDKAGEVVAYFTLAPHLVRREELPSRIGRGAPDTIPCVLLARLALDRSLQGRGVGATLLAHALEVALDAMQKGGGRLIVVDAIDSNASSFYAHHGFVPVPSTRHRLVIKASDAARSLGMRWR